MGRKQQSWTWVTLMNHNRKRLPVSWGCLLGFPGASVVKNLPAKAGDVGLISGSGRSPGGGNGNPLQYSHQDNLMDCSRWGGRIRHDWARTVSFSFLGWKLRWLILDLSCSKMCIQDYTYSSKHCFHCICYLISCIFIEFKTFFKILLKLIEIYCLISNYFGIFLISFCY